MRPNAGVFSYFLVRVTMCQGEPRRRKRGDETNGERKQARDRRTRHPDEPRSETQWAQAQCCTGVPTSPPFTTPLRVAGSPKTENTTIPRPEGLCDRRPRSDERQRHRRACDHPSPAAVISVMPMKRVLALGGIAAVAGVVFLAVLLRPDEGKRPWKTTDVWYRESDVATLARTARPQLVEFFHPD